MCAQSRGKVTELLFHCICMIVQPLLVPGDLTNEDNVKKTVEQTIAHFGRLDVLVNSAGILAMGSIETTDLAQYDKVMNVNVRWDRKDVADCKDHGEITMEGQYIIYCMQLLVYNLGIVFIVAQF